MKYCYLSLAAILTTVLALSSCNGVTRNSVAAAADTVTFNTTTLTDTSSFVKINGERVAIYADATITHPVLFRDSTTTQALVRLFTREVFGLGDTLTLAEAMKAYVGNSLHQYDMTTPDNEAPNDGHEEEMDDEEIVYKYNTAVTITPMRNDHGILTVVKVEVVKKNDQVTSVTHRYYNFDVQNMVLIDPARLFRDDALGDVCQLMKNQLLHQNQVTNEEQLNELGYFNVDNIVVSRNFYFDDNGITWSFMPGILAVEAVGEPHISLPYDILENYAADGSPLLRLK